MISTPTTLFGLRVDELEEMVTKFIKGRVEEVTIGNVVIMLLVSIPLLMTWLVFSCTRGFLFLISHGNIVIEDTIAIQGASLETRYLCQKQRII